MRRDEAAGCLGIANVLSRASAAVSRSRASCAIAASFSSVTSPAPRRVDLAQSGEILQVGLGVGIAQAAPDSSALRWQRCAGPGAASAVSST